MGLRLHNGGRPHRSENPCHRLEISLHVARYTDISWKCAHRRTRQLDPIQEVSETGIVVPVAAFAFYIISNIIEYLQCGLSFCAWWYNQRMLRISSLTAWLFGLLSVILKILDLSEAVFEVTRKDQNSSGNDECNDPGRFTFDSSPMFVPGTAIVLLHIFAFTIGLIRVAVGSGTEAGLGELVCSGWFLLSFWPFVRGLFGKGSYGIPWPLVVKATVIATMFMYWFHSI